jgi:hypothetical protein
MLERTYTVDGARAALPKVAASRADPGSTDKARQLPHRIALICFAGDALVVLACLLAAFWLRFDTGLRNFGVETPGISLADYYRYVVCGTVSLLLVLAQKRMYDGGWQRALRCHRVTSAALSGKEDCATPKSQTVDLSEPAMRKQQECGQKQRIGNFGIQLV